MAVTNKGRENKDFFSLFLGPLIWLLGKKVGKDKGGWITHRKILSSSRRNV